MEPNPILWLCSNSVYSFPVCATTLHDVAMRHEWRQYKNINTCPHIPSHFSQLLQPLILARGHGGQARRPERLHVSRYTNCTLTSDTDLWWTCGQAAPSQTSESFALSQSCRPSSRLFCSVLWLAFLAALIPAHDKPVERPASPDSSSDSPFSPSPLFCAAVTLWVLRYQSA